MHFIEEKKKKKKNCFTSHNSLQLLFVENINFQTLHDKYTELIFMIYLETKKKKKRVYIFFYYKNKKEKENSRTLHERGPYQPVANNIDALPCLIVSSKLLYTKLAIIS